MADDSEMKRAIEALMQKRGVSFVELTQQVPGFRGDYEMTMRETLVLWRGLSQEAVDALAELVAERRIHMKPTSPLTYVIDGVLIRMPIAKRWCDYKTRRWMPMIFNPGRWDEAKSPKRTSASVGTSQGGGA